MENIFKIEPKPRIKTITSRTYKLMSCHKIIKIRANLVHIEALSFEIEEKSGYLSIKITNLNTNDEFDVTKLNFKLDHYHFPLIKGNNYLIEINAKAASGSYRIRKIIIR